MGPSPSAAALIPAGFIPSHSSCHVYTCSTYSAVNSLMCDSVAIFEDNHLVEKLLQRWSVNPQVSAAQVQLWGDALKCEKSSVTS